MRRPSRGWGVTLGAIVSVAALLAGAAETDARAARSRSRSRLRIVFSSVDRDLHVQLSERIEIRFNGRVSKRSLTDGSIAVVPYDWLGFSPSYFGAPRPGTFTRRGRKVIFTPTLPTNLRDPDDWDGEFFPTNDPLRDAYENGTFRPGTAYVVLSGGVEPENPVRVSGRAAPNKTTLAPRFRTTDGLAWKPLYSPDAFGSRLPAQAQFVNPPDRVLSATYGYSEVAGTRGVAKSAYVTVFGNGVPLRPFAGQRYGSDVELLRIAVDDVPHDPVPVAGHVLLDQSGPITSLVFRPFAALEYGATYALRIDESVTDIAGIASVAANPGRLHLSAVHEWLSQARADNPTLPPEQIPDPPRELIADWPPYGTGERGVLKARLLNIGDTQPLLIDPRVFTVFTVREESPGGELIARRAGVRSVAVARIVTPLGVCGSWGSGAHVPIVFALSDRRSRDVAIDAEYGIDQDDNGVIDDDEFATMTLDRRSDLDPSVLVHRRRAPAERRFPSAEGAGRLNALMWSSVNDLGLTERRIQRGVYTPQGRDLVVPGDEDGGVLEVQGSGVVVRLRPRRGKRALREWVYTAPFELLNGTAPELTIDDVASSDVTEVAWSAIDDDSEDRNANGVLDPLELEDVNGNGRLDLAFLAVAFDFVVLGPDEDVSGLPPAELAALDWQPCTRSEGRGDGDTQLAAGGALGRPYVFAWDHAEDGVSLGSRAVLRGRTFDESQLHSAWGYRTDVTIVGE